MTGPAEIPAGPVLENPCLMVATVTSSGATSAASELARPGYEAGCEGTERTEHPGLWHWARSYTAVPRVEQDMVLGNAARQVDFTAEIDVPDIQVDLITGAAIERRPIGHAEGGNRENTTAVDQIPS